MRVTFCAYDRPDIVSGPNSWLRRLLPELPCYGIETQVLFIKKTAEETPTVRELRRRGIACSEIILPPDYGLDANLNQVVRRILERVAEDPPDLFVPNVVHPAYYAGRWVRGAGIPTVGVLHSDDSFHRFIQRTFVFGECVFRVSGLACVSLALEQEILEQQPGTVLVRRLPYGVPLPQHVVGTANGRLRLVYAGRLIDEQKHISEVTRALCRATREVPDTEAVIYGDGPARPAVERILLQQRGDSRVRLAGRVDSDQMQEHLLQCHVLVLLSDYEGLPIGLMEAMSCGLVPICLSTRSGVPELVEHEVNGLLVSDRGDGLVSAVRRLRSESLLWERLSRAARAKIEVQYSNEECALRWSQFLRALQRNGDPHRPLAIPPSLNLPPTQSGPGRLLHRVRQLATRH